MTLTNVPLVAQLLSGCIVGNSIDNVIVMRIAIPSKQDDASQGLAGTSLIVRTTLSVGRWLTVGSFWSLSTASSNCGRVVTWSLGTMWTTLKPLL